MNENKLTLWFCRDKDPEPKGTTQFFFGELMPDRDNDYKIWCCDDDPIGHLYDYQITEINNMLNINIPTTWEEEPLKVVLTVSKEMTASELYKLNTVDDITNDGNTDSENYVSFL